MSTFLKNQRVKNDERRKKVVRHYLIKVQGISLIVLVWFVFVGCIYGLYYMVFEKGLFVVKTVEVKGDFVNLTRDEIVKAADINTGSNIFGLNLNDVEKKISSIPWVKEVAVARKLPGTIWIYINEYVPYAILLDRELYYVDRDGVAFKMLSYEDNKDFPILTGGNKDKLLAILDAYSNMPIADYLRLAEINMDAARGFSIVAGDGGTIVRLGFDRIDEKLATLYSMLSAIQAGHGRIRYVDMNISGKVVVKYES